MKNQKGFTLIEVLVTVALLSVIMTGLFAAFQSGLAAFARSEDYLARERDQEVFFMQLNRELRNAIPYSPHPFVGKGDSLRFPARLNRYTAKGAEEGIYLIEYQFKSGVLIRKESRLKKESLKEPVGTPEVLFESITGHFDFLEAQEGNARWNPEWINKPYTGLPRGVRVELRGRSADSETHTQLVLIPQGFIEKRL